MIEVGGCGFSLGMYGMIVSDCFWMFQFPLLEPISLDWTPSDAIRSSYNGDDEIA